MRELVVHLERMVEELLLENKKLKQELDQYKSMPKVEVEKVIEKVTITKYTSTLNGGIKKKVKQRDNYSCTTCGYQEELHVHHKVPTSEGGTNELSNLTTICVYCHYEIHKDEPQGRLLKSMMKYPDRVK
jgi:hypothetical protein